MNILINASNLKMGGGLQVADSICHELYKYSHRFILIYSKALSKCIEDIDIYGNITFIEYDIPIDVKILLTGRCAFLDKLVEREGVDVVLTIFGPSRWCPHVPHLSGFARAQLVLRDSPYWQKLSISKRFNQVLKNAVLKYLFNKCSNRYFTENPYISERLQDLFPNKEIYTVTNNANQVFHNKSMWINSINLPPFEGVTMLYITAGLAQHKNVEIMIPIAEYLENHFPDINFRFVLTVTSEEFNKVPKRLHRHFVLVGRVGIRECPHLYEQCDIMFMPSLLECFSATYPEAMIMRVPIITTDLSFAHGICGEAACYYDAVSVQSAAEAIIKVCRDNEYRKKLIEAGIMQLQCFDTYEQRAEKLIHYSVEIAKNH